MPDWCCFHDPAAFTGIVIGDLGHVFAYLLFGSCWIIAAKRTTNPSYSTLRPLFVWVGAFVISCGLTHLSTLLSVLHPAMCEVQAVTKLVSAGISVGTLAQAYLNRETIRLLLGFERWL